MPVDLDDTDIAILKSLMADGRKSFRSISREIKVSAPTVKARYERLVNMRLIKSIKPEIDISKIGTNNRQELGSSLQELNNNAKHFHLHIGRQLKVKIKCDFCGGPVHDKPKVLKFATFERFFCCTQCRASYKEKHAGRIEMLRKQFDKRNDHYFL